MYFADRSGGRRVELYDIVAWCAVECGGGCCCGRARSLALVNAKFPDIIVMITIEASTAREPWFGGVVFSCLRPKSAR